MCLDPAPEGSIDNGHKTELKNENRATFLAKFLWVSLRSCKEYDQQGNDRKVTLCARLQGV